MAEEKKSSGPLGDDSRLSKTVTRDDRSSADVERVEKDGTALTMAVDAPRVDSGRTTYTSQSAWLALLLAVHNQLV